MHSGASGKEPTCQCKRHKRCRFNPGSGRSPEEGIAAHSNILAWRIPWTEEPGKLHSVANSWTQLKWLSTQPHVPNTGVLQYIRQMLTSIRGKIDRNTLIVGNFNTPVIPMDRASRQKINKETQALSDTIDQIALIVIYRTVHSKVTKYILFSSACAAFSRIGHILGHKSSLRKFKKIGIISSIFSDHNTMRFKINYRGKKQTKNCYTST